MSWLGLGLGDLGSQIGQGHDIALDWRAREQAMAMAQARQKIESIMLPLQLQELQKRIQMMGQPRNELISGPGGATYGLPVPPTGPIDTSKLQTIVPGAPVKKPSLKDQYEAESDPQKKQKILEDLVAETQALTGAKRTPLAQLQQEAKDAYDNGDMETYKAKLGQIQQLQASSKAPTAPTKIGLIMRAQAGDPQAKAALDAMNAEDLKMAQARGMGFGAGRAAYQIGAYYDEGGTLVPMSNLDAINQIHAGKTLTPAGKLSPKDAIAFQQFNNEAQPAIALAKASAKAYDNQSDKIIFAKIMQGAGTPAYGQESAWLSNVMKQALASNLSPEGRSEAMAISRLNETVGRMRSILGLPSTDTAMQLTLSLVPGPMTPDSKYALGQIDMLEQMANLAVNIPAMRNVVPNAQGPGGSLDSDLDRIFGKAKKP